jgi:5-methylcytosine-specific restriction endonuclease McrA
MADVPAPLPHPDAGEIASLPVSGRAKEIYRLLYRTRDAPLTMLEIRSRISGDEGEEQLDRRRRELNKYFVIEKQGSGRNTRYRLSGRKAAAESEALGISERVRAQVLQYGRCAMCGRTVADHGVVLQVDHKLPQSWGGTNDTENLQALCSECNRGKKDHFRTLEQYGRKIAAASKYTEPHKRIGELLKAFSPGEVRSDIIEMVAHHGQYQEDWHKRMRELRELGWDYKPRRERDEQGRTRVYYRLTRWHPWPSGNIRTEISRREHSKKPKRGPGSPGARG